MAKNILEWNFPPGTTSESYDINEYRRTANISSAEEFKGILQSLSGADPVDPASLNISNNTAISQLAFFAVREALKWVDSGGTHYEHGEFADMFRAFWIALSSLVHRPDWSPDSFTPEDCREATPGVMELFNRELGRVRADSLRWAVACGQVILKDTEIGPSLEPSLPLRRSALGCLTDLAARELLPEEARKLVDDRHASGPTVWRRLGFQDAELITVGMAPHWRSLLEGLGLSEELLIQFIALYASDELVMGQIGRAVRGMVPTWFTLRQLRDMGRRHADVEGDEFDEAGFDRALDLYTLCPRADASGRRWVPVPLFVRVGGWYLPYFPAVLMMHPNLVTLNMLMHKHEREWSGTVGSGAASAEDWLGEVLEQDSKNCVFATGVKKKPIKGDIDLAIYDRTSKVLIVCELKSIFDRFRSRQHLRTFVSGKFDKAVEQLRPKVEAVRAAYTPGNASVPRWPLRDIFSNRVDETPARVVPLVLNWWDAFDYTIGTDDEDILCCNVRAFRFLFRCCAGRLDRLADAIRILSGVFCVVQATGRTIKFEGREVEFWQEDPLNRLPPLEELQPPVHQRFVVDQLKLLPVMPKNWREQTLATGYDPRIFRFLNVYRRRIA
jgi:hypothetical protein